MTTHSHCDYLESQPESFWLDQQADTYEAFTAFEREQNDFDLYVQSAAKNPIVRELLAACREVIRLGGTQAQLLRPAVAAF